MEKRLFTTIGTTGGTNMKNWVGVLLILALVIVPGIVAKALAQTSGTNSIAITSTMGGDSQAAVSGSYTLASGYNLLNIQVYAQPTGENGGQGGASAASTGSGSFNASVLVPPDATYDVQACLTVSDSNGDISCYFSSLATGLYVPNGPP